MNHKVYLFALKLGVNKIVSQIRVHFLKTLKNLPPNYQVSFGSYFPPLYGSTDRSCLVKQSLSRMKYPYK